MKNFASTLIATAALAVSVFTAKAQTSGVYFFAGFTGLGGTNTLPALSTNYYQTNYVWTQLDLGYHESGFGTVPGSPFIMCEEFTNIAITLAAVCPSNFTGTVPFRFAKSFDHGATYEAVPSVVIPLTFTGTNRAETSVLAEMIAANELALVDAENTNAFSLTNLYGVVNFKAGKVATRQAVR